MTGDKRSLLLFSLALITTFQQSYHNYQRVVMPNEMVSLYCHDYPLNDLLFMFCLSLVL